MWFIDYEFSNRADSLGPMKKHSITPALIGGMVRLTDGVACSCHSS